VVVPAHAVDCLSAGTPVGKVPFTEGRYSKRMGKPPRGKRLEDALDALRLAAKSQDEHAFHQSLRLALRSGSSLLAKKAADLAKANAVRYLREDLEFALHHFLLHPAEDRGCLAKESIAAALMDDPDASDEVWLAAARHVQMEGSFGPPVDAAATLRGMAAMGVAASRARNKMHVLVDLLLDPQPAARVGAARALGYLGTAEALTLVRYKALLGDSRPDVVGECFRALLLSQDDREENLCLIATHLDSANEALAEEAALALGESRDLLALPLLMDCLQRTASAEARATLLRAVALLRREEAFTRLAAWLLDASPHVRAQARLALSVFRDEPLLAGLFPQPDGPRIPQPDDPRVSQLPGSDA
jgi:hypothetical protein